MRVYRLENPQGMVVNFIAMGGIITAIEVPDRAGNRANVVLGLRHLEDYAKQRIYLGCITGRYANRIANARFSLDGCSYQLTPTDGTSSVHGGGHGFDKAVWRVSQQGSTSALLRHQSPDRDEGYPGTLDISVRYSLSEMNELRFDYQAVTDKPTVINLTNHSYFNLAGEGTGDILAHRLQVQANKYTPADSILIPTGSIATVEGTPFDFREPRVIGERIATPHPQIIAGKGYDLNYVIDRDVPGALVHAARLSEAVSGRTMEVLTTEPGLQLYTGNLLDGTIEGQSGRLYRQSAGICLETHHYPDSPNQPDFPSVVLRAGDTYRSTTIYRFGVELAN
jgi:aldose 1-epimerase